MKQYTLVENNITYYVSTYYYRDKKRKIITYYKDKDYTIRHRLDGPAVIVSDYEIKKILRQEYWINNKCHNENGPAVIDIKRKEYWYNNKELRQIKSTKKLKEYINNL